MQEQIKVWDIFIRVFHWSVVTSFVIAFITEDDVMWLHELAGYAILVLLGLRFIWGFIGTRYARFSNFIYGIDTIKQYFQDVIHFSAKRYVGHNPLGGLMVVILMLMLLITCLTGLVAENEIFEEIHEFFANTTLLFVLLHIGGVVFSSLVHNENLVRAMITGRKKREE